MSTCPIYYIPGSQIAGPNGSTNGYWMTTEACVNALRIVPTWVSATKAPAPAPVPPPVLAASALSRAPWPAIRLATSPPSGRLAVNFPAWLAVVSGWQTVHASASAGGITTSVAARPVSVRWSMGDGNSVPCSSQGNLYDSALTWQQNIARRACGYMYAAPSTNQPAAQYLVTATVTYAVTWSVVGATGGGSLGTYQRSGTLRVSVGEIESLDG